MFDTKLFQLARAIPIILLGAFAAQGALADDPHRIYEQNCAGCHEPHAGYFVLDRLESRDGELYGLVSGRSVRSFLEAGHGRLSPTETELLMEHFIAIRRSGGLFREKCEICHVRAVDVARSKLVIREGKLIGRYSGVDTAQFLAGHGRLTAEELPVMVEVLRRQLVP